MPPSAAVITDRCYNGGFMAGRLSGIFVSQYLLRPRNMIFASLVTCVGAAILLVAVAGTSVIGLYVGTGKFS